MQLNLSIYYGNFILCINTRKEKKKALSSKILPEGVFWPLGPTRKLILARGKKNIGPLGLNIFYFR
jgi:hypothetical protein